MSTNDDYSYDYTAINNVRILTIVVASISVLFPLSVVVILTQKYKYLVRGKSLVHYVLMIAIADTMTSIAIAFGYPSAGILCSAQGFLFLFFARMSWFFTDVLVLQLFCIVVFRQYFLNVKYMHCIVWSVNIMLQFLPYTTGTIYSTNNDGGNPVNCSLANGKGTYDEYLDWLQYAFNIELIVSFCMIIALSAVVVFYSINMKSTETSHFYLAQRIRESWSIVLLYPCAMFVAWVPSTIYTYYLNYLHINGKKSPYHNNVINNYLSILNSLYGPLLSLIFYLKTVDARRAWMDNFRYMFYTKADVDLEASRCSSIISIEDSEITTSGIRKVWGLKIFRLWTGSNQVNIQNQEINPMSNVTRIPDEL